MLGADDIAAAITPCLRQPCFDDFAAAAAAAVTF